MSDELYIVSMDGRVLHRGLSRAEAERIAAHMTDGVLRKRGGTGIRVADFDVKPDLAARQARESNYKTWKES